MRTRRTIAVSGTVIVLCLGLLLTIVGAGGCSQEEDCQAGGYTCGTDSDCCDGLTCEPRPFSSFYECR